MAGAVIFRGVWACLVEGLEPAWRRLQAWLLHHLHQHTFQFGGLGPVLEVCRWPNLGSRCVQEAEAQATPALPS